jgi:hypothetical protein
MVSSVGINSTRRRSNYAIAIIGLAGLLLVASLATAWKGRLGAEEALTANQRLVSRLQLTDICLFTEARFTRHPTQADLNTPFQAHPLSFDHFPSGSLIKPPAGMTGER